MANYKKLTDVEVMEEVSENSMALVNENGVLKQVPCGAGFGGGGSGIVTVHYDGENYSSATTFAEFATMIQDSTLQMVIFWNRADSNDFNVGYASSIYFNGMSYYITFFDFNGNSNSIQWNSSGISLNLPAS